MNFRKYAYDWIVWALFACVPLVVFWQIATSLAAQGVSGGDAMQNAAMFPRIVAWVMVGLTAINLLRILGGRISDASGLQATPTTRLALVATGIAFAYLLLLPWAGYYIATPVAMALLFRLFGLNTGFAIAGGVAATVGVAAVFEGILNVVLPLGIPEYTLFG